MTTPNMSSITASLEISFHNFSLNHHHPNSYNSSSSDRSAGGGGGGNKTGGGSGAGFQENQHHLSNTTSESTYELNSHISLPHHWEQCIDLKTGELYYMNWRTGMTAKEDPRTAGWNGDFDEESEDDDADDDDDDYDNGDSSYDSEDSSTEESPPSFSRKQSINKVKNQSINERANVLVVAGCKICMMYFMVPKHVEDCPKCNGQLLHFDKSENPPSP